MFTKLTFAIVIAVLCLGMSSQTQALANSVSQPGFLVIAEDPASNGPLYGETGNSENPLFAVAQKR